MNEKVKNKKNRKISIITVFLWIFLVVSMLTIVISNANNSNALEGENIENSSKETTSLIYEDKYENSVIVSSSRGEFTPTDNTPICVQKWDFNNIKHPYEYYKYLTDWYNNRGATQYAQYTKYVNNESDISCFERCQNYEYTGRDYFMPNELQSRKVHPGENVIFAYRTLTRDFSDAWGRPDISGA